MQQKFSLETIASMDGGRLAIALAEAIKRMESDCRDRPSLDKPRTVTFMIGMRPVADPDSDELAEVTVKFSIGEKIPKRESLQYTMKPTAKGLIYNDLSKDNPDQTTIDDVDNKRKVN